MYEGENNKRFISNAITAQCHTNKQKNPILEHFISFCVNSTKANQSFVLVGQIRSQISGAWKPVSNIKASTVYLASAAVIKNRALITVWKHYMEMHNCSVSCVEPTQSRPQRRLFVAAADAFPSVSLRRQPLVQATLSSRWESRSEKGPFCVDFPRTLHTGFGCCHGNINTTVPCGLSPGVPDDLFL